MARLFIAQRAWILSIIFVLINGSLAAYISKRGTTVTLPDGVTYHPESQDICTSTSWTDVVSFFVGNYLSHVATIVKSPGEPLYITGLNMFFVLLFPCFGAGRGLATIYQRASFVKDPLQQALKAQALVMVIREPSKWTPHVGDSLRSLSLWPPTKSQTRPARMSTGEYFQAARCKSWIKANTEKFKGYKGRFEIMVRLPPWLTIHSGLGSLRTKVESGYHVSGTCDLPEGYRLAYVPSHAQVEHVMSEVALSRILQTSYSLASGVISIVQIISACSALYQSKGYQIEAYGYAAFGFSVTPYLVMSFLNLLANCFTPSFPNLYLVHTEIMDEAIARGGQFTDIVGKLKSEPLLVEDLTLFSASIEPPPLPPSQWQREGDNEIVCHISTQMFEHGSIEPIPEARTIKHEGKDDEPAASQVPAEISATQESASLTSDEKTQKQAAVTVEQARTHGQLQNQGGDRDNPEDTLPVVIVPSCYQFKTAYSKAVSTSTLNQAKHSWRNWTSNLITWCVAALPFIPLGVMSKFRTGTSSTIAQRVWLMAWYVVGTVSVPNPFFTDHVVDVTFRGSLEMLRDPEIGRFELVRTLFYRAIGVIGMLVLYMTPAIGGFVVVGQMLVAYGTCTSV